MKAKELKIYFGVLADKISMQLKKHKIKFDPEKIMRYERAIEAVNRLRMDYYLTNSALVRIEKKIYKNILRHVIKSNHSKALAPEK